ncbi:MAG: barstar family protein [Dorea sp.]|nr:barstar family protein [Dorea sp.]
MFTCKLDGKLIKDRETLHGILADLPGFPDWYGRNLDALHDCLTDIHEEIWIQVQNENDLALHLGNYAAAFLNVLAASAKENENIHYMIGSN